MTCSIIKFEDGSIGMMCRRGQDKPRPLAEPPHTPKTPLPFPVDARVRHKVYGDGTVTRASATRTEVWFDLSGAKEFVTELAKLEKLS